MEHHQRWLAPALLYLLGSLLAMENSAWAAPTVPVWVVSNGFHSSVAMRAEDFPLGARLVQAPRARLVLVGWGASDYYRGRKDPVTVVRALLGTESTLHLLPIFGGVRDRFPRSDIVRLELRPGQARALAGELEAALARDAAGRPVRLGSGYFPQSHFYRGRESFYFPYLCNTWLALRLRRAGVAICVPVAITAPNLVWQMGRIGRLEGKSKVPVDRF